MTAATGSQNSALALNAIVLALGKAAGTLSMIALFVMLSYLFSTSDYGSFRQALLINKGLLEVAALGIPMSIYYFLSRLRNSEKKYFILQSLFLLAALGSTCSVAVFLSSNLIADAFDNTSLAPLLRLFSLYPFFVLPTLALESVLVTLGHTRRYAIFLILDKTILILLAGIAALLFQSIAGLFLVLLAFSVIELLAALWLVRKAVFGLGSERPAASIKTQLRVALPSGLSNIVGIINVELDKIIIGLYLTVEQFAVYANGAFEIPFLGTVANATTSVLMPEYVRSHEERNYQKILELWHGAIVRVGILFIPVVAFLFFNAREFITLMFSEKYVGSALIFQIYLIAHIPKLTWYGPILVSMGYAREPLIASILSLVCNVALNLVFINLLGLTGPAIATVMTTYVLTSYYILRIRTAMGLTISRVFPWKALAKLLLIASLTAAILASVKTELQIGSFWLLSVGFIIYMGIVLGICRLTDIVTPDDVYFIKEQINRFRFFSDARANRSNTNSS